MVDKYYDAIQRFSEVCESIGLSKKQADDYICIFEGPDGRTITFDGERYDVNAIAIFLNYPYTGFSPEVSFLLKVYDEQNATKLSERPTLDVMLKFIREQYHNWLASPGGFQKRYSQKFDRVPVGEEIPE